MTKFEYTISTFEASKSCLEVNVMTFSIPFCESLTPKDVWDHRDAVKDYLIDAVLGAFESIPNFEIRKIRQKTEDGWRSLPPSQYVTESIYLTTPTNGVDNQCL